MFVLLLYVVSACSLDVLLYAFPCFLAPTLWTGPSRDLAVMNLAVHQPGWGGYELPSLEGMKPKDTPKGFSTKNCVCFPSTFGFCCSSACGSVRLLSWLQGSQVPVVLPWTLNRSPFPSCKDEVCPPLPVGWDQCEAQPGQWALLRHRARLCLPGLPGPACTRAHLTCLLFLPSLPPPGLPPHTQEKTPTDRKEDWQATGRGAAESRPGGKQTQLFVQKPGEVWGAYGKERSKILHWEQISFSRKSWQNEALNYNFSESIVILLQTALHHGIWEPGKYKTH